MKKILLKIVGLMIGLKPDEGQKWLRTRGVPQGIHTGVGKEQTLAELYERLAASKR